MGKNKTKTKDVIKTVVNVAGTVATIGSAIIGALSDDKK